MILPLVDVIFVPQGAEYQAVVRGLAAVDAVVKPQIYPLAIGPQATQKITQEWLQSLSGQTDFPQRVLLMGLCGSLQPRFGVGDVVLCEALQVGFQHGNTEAGSTGGELNCDRNLNTRILARCAHASLGNAVTVKQLVHSAEAKRELACDRQRAGENAKGSVDIVEMEGYTLLSVLQPAGLSVSMLRVVSDDCQHDLPDLSVAIASDGQIQPFPLALCFLRQPLGAARLIYGSLKALSQLQETTKQLFQQACLD